MELQFKKNAYSCLRRAAREVKTEELTQEMRLPEAMPDIGRVLGAWGQGVIRSKEWRGSSMSVSGGVMVWVLYAPEDGSMPRSLEGWLPFQLHWDLLPTQRDGVMVVGCTVGSTDARSVSARKLMLRTGVSVTGEALEPVQLEFYTPAELPADVQLLRSRYPLCMPIEAGEKAFTLEQTLQPQSEAGPVQKVLYCHLQPVVTDRKVLGGRMVYRGDATLQVLYRCQDGSLHSERFALPFSQYAELEGEYPDTAFAGTQMAVTTLELEPGEGDALRLKAGIVGQYVIYDRPELEVVTDAYSTSRSIALQYQPLRLSAVLERRTDTVALTQPLPTEMFSVVDACISLGQPDTLAEGDTVRGQLRGTVQLLYSDEAGLLNGTAASWEESVTWTADADTDAWITAGPTEQPELQLGAQPLLRSSVPLEIFTTRQLQLPMVSGIELGEQLPADRQRPSLILRRAGEQSLWELAKSCGSTVEAITGANRLEGEPEPGRMLLIPIS